MALGDITGLFNHQFTISRASLTDDGQGGTVREYQNLDTIPGFMDPASVRATERIVAMQQQTRQLYMLFCLPTDIQRGDQVVIADPPPAFIGYVMSVKNPAMLNHHLEVLIEEAQKGDPGVI